ncbi:hypothetical protein [Micromonospora rhizosphaerae]|uniref:hypothetical protein n=1 Tax=Micromonospora rhizosphaerae TaxID=568872 RepID=UPI00159F292C|nr:hypothetical protein [Micromonospora rhizosphaerae]
MPSRIDIYFPGVERMLLSPSYPGLNAAVASSEEAALYRERYGEIGPHHTLFTLEPDLGSFVIAGVMQWYQDQGGYDDVSVFGRFD